MSSKVETESGAATKPELRDINNVQSLEQRLAKATERRDLLQVRQGHVELTFALSVSI